MQTKERQGLSKALKGFYGIGDFGFSLMSNIDTYYSSFFFTNVAKFSLSAFTIATTVSSLVDAVLNMVYGAWLNKIQPKKWGRYRSWLILTPWIVPFLYAMQFVKISNGVMGVVFVTVAMITSRMAWSIPYTANIAMIKVAGKDSKDRMALSSSRSAYSSLSSVVYSYAGPAAVALFTGFVGESNAYAATAFAFAILFVAGYFAHFKMFEGYEEPGEVEIARLAKENAQRSEEKKAQKISAIAAVTCNPHLISVILSLVMRMIVMFVTSGLMIYYFKYVAKNLALFSTLLFALSLLSVVVSYLARFVVARLGAKNTVIVNYAIMIVSLVVSYFMYTNVIAVIVLMVIMNAALRLSYACDAEIFSLCSIYSTKKLGYDTTGTIMGLTPLPIKIAIILRSFFIAATLSIAGFDPSISPAAASAAMQQGLCFGYMIIPAIVTVIGALIMLFGFRLKSEQNA